MSPGRTVFAAVALTGLLACGEAPTEPVAQDLDVPQYARGGQPRVQVCQGR